MEGGNELEGLGREDLGSLLGSDLGEDGHAGNFGIEGHLGGNVRVECGVGDHGGGG